MITDFHSLLLKAAHEEGFPLAGALDLNLAGPSLLPHVERYDNWIQAGHAGAMGYLARGRDRRANPRVLMPSAQSILCVALPYPKQASGAATPAEGPRYARYIHGRDYHDEISDRLERVMQSVASRWKATTPLEWKVCVDTSAVLERSWAALAGLGWIGKNTLLIHPKHGSYLVLGEVLINQSTGHGPQPLPDYCGACTRCLKACPTKAFKEPHDLDATRCISYWTLEKRGDLALAEADKRAIGPWIAGCDICQEVCPFNLKPTKNELAQTPPTHAPDSADLLKSWEALLKEEIPDYKTRVSNSALSRVKPTQFSRNLAITLTNSISQDPALAVRFRPWVEKRVKDETDEFARAEWRRCLDLLGPVAAPEGQE
jgi:epoxyqueuosine reductase